MSYGPAALFRMPPEPIVMVGGLRVINGYPPNYPELDATFGIRHVRGVIVTYGQAVYLPSGGRIAPEILDHERVHSERQGADPEGWWRRYIEDVAFRLDEELLGHIAEYRGALKRRGPGKKAHAVLERAATRLASALYGEIVTVDHARRAILEGRLT